MDPSEGVKVEYDPNILGQTDKQNMDYTVESFEKLLTESVEPESTPIEQPTEPPASIESTESQEPAFTYQAPPQIPQVPDYIIEGNRILQQQMEQLSQAILDHERSPMRHSTDLNIKGAWSATKMDMESAKLALIHKQHEVAKMTMEAVKPLMEHEQQAQRQQAIETQKAWDAEMQSLVPDFGDSLRTELVTYLRGKGIHDQRIAAYTPKEAAAFYNEMKGGKPAIQKIPLKPKVQPMDAEQQRQARLDEAERQIRRSNFSTDSLEANAMRLAASGYVDEHMPVQQMAKSIRNKPAPEPTLDTLKNRLRQTGRVDDAGEVFYKMLFGGQ